MVERLTAKVGPLPVWAWALILFVGIALALRFTNRGNNATSDTTTTADPVGPTALDADTTPIGTDTGSPPAASGQGNVAGNMTDDLYTQLGGLSASVDGLTALVQTAPGLWGYSDAGAGAAVPLTGAQPAAKTAPKPPTKPAAKQPAKATARPSGPIKFYTYRPGKAPKGQKAQEAPARGPSGTTLKFRAGKGYYYG